MNDAERTASVRGCKFVDAVEEKCPYVMTAEYLDFIIKKASSRAREPATTLPCSAPLRIF